MAVDTTDNISHAALGALGLVSAMAPSSATAFGRSHPSHA
jgi:hypothetical protein